MKDLHIERAVSTLLGIAVAVSAYLAFQRRADHSALALGEWIIMAICIAGPLLVAWTQNDNTSSRTVRQSLTWLSTLVYIGILMALQIK